MSKRQKINIEHQQSNTSFCPVGSKHWSSWLSSWFWPVVSIDTKIRETDEEKPSVPWAELPSIAIENIYSYISREDQRNMSMVCRNWFVEYSSPILWRKFTFLIPAFALNLEVYPEVHLARKYGDMFHHVEIVWPVVIHTTYAELIWKQIKLFLEALNLHSQLETVKFLHLAKNLRYQDGPISHDVYQTVKYFFSSQHNLKTVQFQNACFKKSEATEILKVITHGNSKTLETIYLKDAFMEEESEDEEEEFDDEEEEEFDDEEEEEFDDEEEEEFDDEEEEESDDDENEAVIFESFLNLKTLQIDYSRFFESIMITFYKHAQKSDSLRMKGNLELIKIFCDGTQSISCGGIPPECWKLLTEICPSLRINLTFGIEAHTINLFIVHHMPLKVLKFEWGRCPGSETEIGVLFRYLQYCGTNKYLEDLNIVWHRNMNNLAVDLINFLQTCRKLRNLQLYIEHPIEYLDIVFISWLENQPSSLQNAFITVGEVQGSEVAAVYSKMADNYCPLLKTCGLNLHLIVDSKIMKRKRGTSQ